MNIEYFKYALEVARTKSINKAAENLYISQPNLSRMIKMLEDEIGIKIFERTKQGIEVTIAGNYFLNYSANIIEEFEKIKSIVNPQYKEQKFSITVPKANYISQTFMSFVSKLDLDSELSIDYKESSFIGAIDNILHSNFNLGIIRYFSIYEPLFEAIFKERGIAHKKLREFEFYVAFSKDNDLAKKDVLSLFDFSNCVELEHGDSYIPYIGSNQTNNFFNTCKKIRIYDSMGQLKMLNTIPNSFMVVFPLDEDTLNTYNLTQRKISDINKTCCDVLIYRKNYVLTSLDKLFIEELQKNIR